MMEAFSAGHLEADARLRLIALSRGYELADLDLLDMIDYLLQRPDLQTPSGNVTDEELGKLLDFYGYEATPAVCN